MEALRAFRLAFWIVFAPMLVATEGFICGEQETSGDTTLTSLELVVDGTDRVALNPALRVYNVWLPAGSTTGTLRATPTDPNARVNWHTYGPESGSFGYGGGEATISLPPDGRAIYVVVYPPGGAVDDYIINVNPLCPEGDPCSDGNLHFGSCTMGSCHSCVSREPEVCDGLDNDCDGLTDEAAECAPANQACLGKPEIGEPCDTGKGGPCADGKRTCYGGRVVCETMAPPQDEIPNDGVDQDCDGEDLVYAGTFETPSLIERDYSSLPPNPEGPGFVVMPSGEFSDWGFAVDPNRRTPLNSAALCTGLLLACFEPGIRNLEGCLENVPTCASATPWESDEVCCPAACTVRTTELGRLGLDHQWSVVDAMFESPSCIPQWDEHLGGGQQ